ncbi:MAG: hypothetical protein F6K00_19485 [Leptolyngbya sp. SIOISBB]|nr:hypothetical protein [Leptolyngbya sp. SIOISBB]
MKIPRYLFPILWKVGFAALSIGVIVALTRSFNQRAQLNQSVPYDVVKLAVEEVISELHGESELTNQKSNLTRDTANLSRAHAAVLTAITNFENAYSSIDCARRNDMAKTVGELQEGGLSFEDAITQIASYNLGEWQKWQADTKGSINGDAELISKPRALVSDSIALLQLIESHYSGISMPICDTELAIEVAEFGTAYQLVLANFDLKADHYAAFEHRQALDVHWRNYQATGSEQSRQAIEAIAEAHSINLLELGIDLDSITAGANDDD